jgi:GH25 family lysozyme M1 (1,4-beta-N-acetylmuramidase)
MEKHHPTSLLLGHQRKVCWLVVAFPQLWHAQTLLWPFWQYSRQETCRTVQAVPDFLVLP